MAHVYIVTHNNHVKYFGGVKNAAKEATDRRPDLPLNKVFDVQDEIRRLLRDGGNYKHKKTTITKEVLH